MGIVGVELMTSAPAVLHLCSAYAKQAIYSELVSRLDGLGVRQCVYVPVRSRSELDRNRKDGLSLATFHYSHILRPSHRVLFRRKIKAVVEDIMVKVDPASLTLVHAHFMYSDGAAALALHKCFGLPYVVTVRNTDVNAFMRFRPDLDGLGREVLSRAQCVVLITPAYREIVLGRVPRHSRASLAAKIHTIPNGLAQFSIQSQPDRRYQIQTTTNLIDWQEAGVVLATNVSSVFTETNSSASGTRYFRAITLP